jgi:hypothetical protein
MGKLWIRISLVVAVAFALSLANHGIWPGHWITAFLSSHVNVYLWAWADAFKDPQVVWRWLEIVVNTLFYSGLFWLVLRFVTRQLELWRFGLATYIISFFLPAVWWDAGYHPGWVCALLALFVWKDNFPGANASHNLGVKLTLFGGLINLLAVSYFLLTNSSHTKGGCMGNPGVHATDVDFSLPDRCNPVDRTCDMDCRASADGLRRHPGIQNRGSASTAGIPHLRPVDFSDRSVVQLASAGGTDGVLVVVRLCAAGCGSAYTLRGSGTGRMASSRGEGTQFRLEIFACFCSRWLVDRDGLPLSSTCRFSAGRTRIFTLSCMRADD